MYVIFQLPLNGHSQAQNYQLYSQIFPLLEHNQPGFVDVRDRFGIQHQSLLKPLSPYSALSQQKPMPISCRITSSTLSSEVIKKNPTNKTKTKQTKKKLNQKIPPNKPQR